MSARWRSPRLNPSSSHQSVYGVVEQVGHQHLAVGIPGEVDDPAHTETVREFGVVDDSRTETPEPEYPTGIDIRVEVVAPEGVDRRAVVDDTTGHGPAHRAPVLDHGHGEPGGGAGRVVVVRVAEGPFNRKSTRLNSSHVKISYAVFC